MNYSYALALFISSITSILCTIVVLRRRAVPGGTSLAGVGAAITIWTLGYAFYWLFTDPPVRLFSLNMAFTGVATLPVVLLIFVLRYTNQISWLRKRVVFFLFILPAMTLVILWVKPLNEWFYGSGGFNYPGLPGGVWFWITLVYTYMLSGVALQLLFRALTTTIRPLRAQLQALIIGIMAPILVNIASLFGFEPFPDLDLTPFALMITCACIVIAFSRYHLLDIIPIARSIAVDLMADGFIVLDVKNRVVDVNQMGLDMLGKPLNAVIGLPAEQVMGRISAIFDRFKDVLSLKEEICVDVDPPMYLDLRITPFYDRMGRFSGRLIVARDVTERKNSEQAEHEQRILAEALQQSAAALNGSRSFEEVLDSILEHVGRVVPYDLASFLLADDDGKAHVARERGYVENGLNESLHKIQFRYDAIPNFRRMVETGQTTVVPDTDMDADWIQYEGLERLKSYVGAPICVRNVVIGFLNLNSFTPGYFNQAHADHLQAFADQAAIAIENARLLEDAQKRAEELSVLLDIGQATTSGLEMKKLLAALLEKCKLILPIEAFYIATYDNETRVIDYPLFYDQGTVSALPGHIISDTPGLTGYIIMNKQMVYVPDAYTEEATRKYSIIHFGGDPSRSYVGVPLLVGERVVGVISMQSSQVNAFTPTHIRLLETIATQAAGAIENARLFSEVRLRAEEMTALFDIGIAITSGLEMEQVLRALLEKCRQILPVEAFYTAILDPETDLIHHPLAYDMGEYPQIPTRHMRDNPGLSGQVINTRRTLYIPDMTSPDAIKSFQIFRTSGTQTKAYVGVPMIVGERVVGVISMQSYKENAYDRDQIRLLETIATQAAVAIENSRLYTKAQQEIAERNKAEIRYRALYEQSHDAVFIIGFDGKHLDANQRATEMLGYSLEEFRALTIKDISMEHVESDTVFERLLAGDHIPLFERKFRKKNGEVIIVEINVELVRDPDGKQIHIQSVAREITERKNNEMAIREANEKLRAQLAEIEGLQAQLREQAIRDPLTGLFNRRYLEETLEREFALAKRQESTVCLVMIDIDGFKEFNDTYGHDAGDYLLKRLGELLRKEVRQSDISCRFGGEEFLVVMPGVKVDKGHERAERLRKAFGAGKFVYMGVKLNATISLGVAVFPEHGGRWEEVLHTADRAMYAAKAAGKNRVRSAGD